MKLLAIDTSTKYLSLGVYNEGALYEYNLEVGPKLSALLALTIKRVLAALNLTIGDLDYFACGLGPGSFTGIRVGLSTLKGISWARKKPLIGISSLDILAMNALKYAGKNIIPVIDAKRSLIYCASYKNINGALKKTSAYALLSKEDLLKKIRQPAVIFGDALNLYKADILKHAPQSLLLDKDTWYPRAQNIISLALLRIKNKQFDDLLKVNTIYVYPKECQIKNAH